jgi:hypothetical protein
MCRSTLSGPCLELFVTAEFDRKNPFLVGYFSELNSYGLPLLCRPETKPCCDVILDWDRLIQKPSDISPSKYHVHENYRALDGREWTAGEIDDVYGRISICRTALGQN